MSSLPATIPLIQLDVFAERLFAGNPAGVCPLEYWLPDGLMQSIAAENNLPETAFYVRDTRDGGDYLLRWFTPSVEIELCGHATLAAGHVVLEGAGDGAQVRFSTLHAGVLTVARREGALWLDLPARMPQPAREVPDSLLRGLGAAPLQVLEFGNKYLALYENAASIAGLQPDFAQLARLGERSVIVSAPGRSPGEDFVSRFFAPGIGIPEDPVTGSAHCLLVPYWAARLGRTGLSAVQLSARGGVLSCRLDGERVWMSGPVRTYLRGEILLPT